MKSIMIIGSYLRQSVPWIPRLQMLDNQIELTEIRKTIRDHFLSTTFWRNLFRQHSCDHNVYFNFDDLIENRSNDYFFSSELNDLENEYRWEGTAYKLDIFFTIDMGFYWLEDTLANSPLTENY